jgi:hypothetical protein
VATGERLKIQNKNTEGEGENGQLRGWPQQCSSVTWIKLQNKHLQPVVYENKTKSLPKTYVDM